MHKMNKIKSLLLDLKNSIFETNRDPSSRIVGETLFCTTEDSFKDIKIKKMKAPEKFCFFGRRPGAQILSFKLFFWH